MRLLLVGPARRLLSRDYFLPWIGYTDRALRQLGVKTTLFPYRESWVASPTLSRALRPFSTAPQRLARVQKNLFDRWARGLMAWTRKLRPDLILVLKGEILSGDLLAQMKRLARGPLVTWWVDDPWGYPSFARNLSLFDHFFIFDRSYIPKLQASGVRKAHFLPCACDETIYRPLRLSPRDRRRFSCDVSFIAWYDPARGELVRAVADRMDLRVWGGGWRSPEARRTLSGFDPVQGGLVNDRTAARIYNASKIGLNSHHSQTRLGGLNTRAFELLACGLFQIVDRVPGIEELLTPDIEVACYGSAEEARELARRYLVDPAARFRMASRGRERVLAEHTYVRRMQTLCEVSQQ